MELQYFYPYKILFTKLDVMLERVRVEQLTIPLIFPLIFQRDRWLVLALCPNRSCEVMFDESRRTDSHCQPTKGLGVVGGCHSRSQKFLLYQ